MPRVKAAKRSGSFVAQFYAGSKRVRRQGFQTASDANAFKARILAAVNAGVPIDTALELEPEALELAARNAAAGIDIRAAAEMTVADLGDAFLKELAAIDRKASTITNVGISFRLHINPEIGVIPLSKLTDSRVIDALRDNLKAKGLKPRVANMHLSKLRSALKFAVTKRWVIRNVATESSLLKVHKEAFGSLPSHNQIADLVKYAADWSPPRGRIVDTVVMSAAIYTLSVTGMRIGELCALRWDAVDIEGLTVRVVAGKTPRARRLISIEPEDMAVIVALRDRVLVGGGQVFVQSSGAPLTEKSLQHSVPQYGTALGFKCWSHLLRHYHASACIEAGMDWKALQERLGHESIMITMDTYGHLRPEFDRTAAARATGFLRAAMAR